jgi:hypothetical protein
LALVVLAGCATSSTVQQIDRLDAIDEEEPRLLVMTPDIKYYLLTAGGVPQPHGEWTEAARRNFQEALVQFADSRGTDLVEIPETTELDEVEISYQKLYSAVGMTILQNHFSPMKLPTKQGSFDWSLGPGVKELGERYGADYALFSFYRDYQASGGRVAFAILAAAAGVGVNTGSEQGYAALVDLDTGDIVWFNMVLAGQGELREQGGAQATVKQLFADLPGTR